VIEPVSGENLCNTGISADRAGDFRQFRSQDWETGSLETKSNARKAGIFGPVRRRLRIVGSRRTAWLGPEDSNLEMANWKSDAIACPRGAAEPLFVGIPKPFETLKFREPYRIRGVQSFGDKWAFRRITSAPCREGVRSSNEKSLPLLGLNRSETLAENMRPRRGGGGRGTGIEPSLSMSA
jgi:hypothetical protein